MLAYVVWHKANPQLELNRYENALKDFHAILANHKPSGFLSSSIIRMKSVPWMETETDLYFDWYFIENSAALDSLNSAAVSGRVGEAHDAVAEITPGGLTALYKPVFGQESLSGIRYVTWLSKPRGTAYPAFYKELDFIRDDPQAGLWMRYLALGPGPEFCLVSSREFELDSRYLPLVKSIDLIWG